MQTALVWCGVDRVCTLLSWEAWAEKWLAGFLVKGREEVWCSSKATAPVQVSA